MCIRDSDTDHAPASAATYAAAGAKASDIPRDLGKNRMAQRHGASILSIGNPPLAKRRFPNASCHHLDVFCGGHGAERVPILAEFHPDPHGGDRIGPVSYTHLDVYKRQLVFI